MNYLNVTLENLENEHLCCAIADKKHQAGVAAKKNWLANRLTEGHVFRKLDARGKVLIEYAPLETAWVPIEGENYLYIYCLWVAGSYKKQGHAHNLLTYCINDAKAQGKSGVCVLSSKKKKPYLTDKKFMISYDFKVVDEVDDYELLALTFHDFSETPQFAESVHQQTIPTPDLTIYYSQQCPFISNCITQIESFCHENEIPVEVISIDSLEKAKTLPCLFNNWAVFYKGSFQTIQLMNATHLKKLLAK